MRSDAQRRRQLILARAREVMAERGGDVALETIAAASGVGIGTLYRNFRSRDDLVRAMVQDTVGRVEDAVRTAEERLAEDPAAAWTGLVHDLVGLDLGAWTDAVGHRAADDGDLGAVQQPALDALDALLGQLRSRGAVRTGFDAAELVVAVATITRPQPAAISAAAPDVGRHLVEAYLAWSMSQH